MILPVHHDNGVVARLMQVTYCYNQHGTYKAYTLNIGHELNMRVYISVTIMHARYTVTRKPRVRESAVHDCMHVVLSCEGMLLQ